MSAESNARSHAESFHWWRGNPEMTEDTAELGDLMALRAAADELIARYVEDMREGDGMTWREVAEALGISTQAARARYGAPPQGRR